jgi:elongation factor P--(R)-beta-lysine ligase
MEPTPHDWQPSATLKNLRLRADLLRRAREYFATQGVMEVETPVLSHAAVTDVHLHSLRTHIGGQGEFFLQTSPEYAMKRLLAAGSGDIYQIARVFRDDERGGLHNPEFTLIEWYRIGFDAPQLMKDAARLLEILLAERRLAEVQHLTYREAFMKEAGVDPLAAPIAALLDCARMHSVALPPLASLDRDGYLDLLMATVVGPRLGADRLTFVYEYPATQAALARLKPGNTDVAERFEIYLDGIELANGFHELGDAQEQRKRFEQDNVLRRQRGLVELPIDERLLAALAAGLPECSGVAVGFDRVVMLAAGSRSLDEAWAFPVERA